MRLQTALTASSFVLSKQMIMKRNYTLNLCYLLCVVIVLLISPVKNYSAIVPVSNESKAFEKVKKAVEQTPQETLHSELLFKY
jgi:hypothetical protein